MAKKVNALVPAVREQECKPHHFMWTGSMPCTGILKCYMCNSIKNADGSITEPEQLTKGVK